MKSPVARRAGQRRAIAVSASALAAVSALSISVLVSDSASATSRTTKRTTKTTAATKPKTTAKSVKGFPVTIQNGKEAVTLKTRPVRIVSLSPTATEMLFAISAGKQVIAVDDQSSYPADAPRTKLSAFTPNLEAVVGYKPDLVISSQEDKVTAGLRAVKIPVLVQSAAEKLDDSYAQIRQLGQATGNDIAATEVVNEMKAKIAVQIARVPASAKGLTFFHELDNTLYSVTSKTFVGQMYATLGLVNIADAADAAGSGYPQLSAEYLVKTNPDFIFLADTKCCAQNAAEVAKRPGWGELKAVKGKAVIGLDDDIASRWGPRVPLLLEQIVNAVDAQMKVRT